MLGNQVSNRQLQFQVPVKISTYLKFLRSSISLIILESRLILLIARTSAFLFRIYIAIPCVPVKLPKGQKIGRIDQRW